MTIFRRETRLTGLATRRAISSVLAMGLFSAAAWAQVNACDLNSDGTVNVADAQLAANMSIGARSCTANIMGSGVCNAAVVQRVINAGLGQSCVTGSGSGANHSVSLNWVASASPNVTGYRVYRGAAAGGPYTLLTSSPVAGTGYTDMAAQGGTTYYYVVTAIDSNNTASINSNEARAVVPSP